MKIPKYLVLFLCVFDQKHTQLLSQPPQPQLPQQLPQQPPQQLTQQLPQQPPQQLPQQQIVCFWQKHTQKPKKLFFSATEPARTVLNAFLECMHLAETCTYPFDGDCRFSKIPVYFQHIPSNVKNGKNIPEFLVYSVYFGVLVTFSQNFRTFETRVSIPDDFWTSTMSDFRLSRNTEFFWQTHRPSNYIVEITQCSKHYYNSNLLAGRKIF